jgi:hypothetical protein
MFCRQVASDCAELHQQRLLQVLHSDANLSEQMQGTPALIIPTIKAKLVKTLLANYAMWPLAHIINFKFIPSSQRILYINCVQVTIAAQLQRLCVCLCPAALFAQSLPALRPVLCLFIGHLECLSVQYVMQSVNSFCWNRPPDS